MSDNDSGCLSLRCSDGRDCGTLCVGTLPGRKRPALYLEWANEYCCQITPLASFVNAEAATQVWRWLQLVVTARMVDQNASTTHTEVTSAVGGRTHDTGQ